MVFNKKIIGAMIIASLGAVATPSAYAATGTSAVEIAGALAIGNASPNLSFGTLTPSTAGTAQVIGDNSVAVTGGTTATGGTVSAAQFAITGTGTLAYLVDLTASDATLTGTGPAMGITYLSYSLNDAAYANAYTAPNNLAAGVDTLRVGGTLTVANTATQTVGSYTGNLVVTVVYQ